MTQPPPTLTVAQAAEALGVSERTVWRYLKAGRLAGETVGPPGGQRTLIYEEAVSRLRGGHAAAAAEAPPPARADELEALAAELAAVRTERDSLRIRLAELERLLAVGRAPRAADVTRRARALAHQATEWTAALRARRGPGGRRPVE